MINPDSMPYAVKFYAYIFVANVLVVVIVARWVKPFGFMVSMAFGLVYAYLAILVGRWCLERSGCRAARTRTRGHDISGAGAELF